MNWFKRLGQGLKKTSENLSQNIAEVFTQKKLDDEMLNTFEEALIMSDMGVETASLLTSKLKKQRFGKEVTEKDVKEFLAEEICKLIGPHVKGLNTKNHTSPCVVLFVGVNGSGKTTSLAKYAKTLKDSGQKVAIVAGDTFRAAAVDQLKVWAERVGCTFYSRPHGADAAALAYESYIQAKKEKCDVILIDTAGRLHNKAGLMDELAKIQRVLKKHDSELPHEVVIVLDGTTGQNALVQVETFAKTVSLTGIILTKLDGTAKGGILVQIAQKLDFPFYAVGIGESIDDLKPFSAEAYARSLVGLNVN